MDGGTSGNVLPHHRHGLLPERADSSGFDEQYATTCRTLLSGPEQTNPPAVGEDGEP
jgi:hypothetical protein